MKFFSVKNNPKHPLYWTYHRARNRWPIWYYWLNREARRFWKKNRQDLKSAQRRIVQDLDRDGIALAPVSDFFGENVFAKLRQSANEFFNQPKIKQEVKNRRAAILNPERSGLHKEFFVYAMGGGTEDRPILDLENPFLRFVLDEKIIGIVAEYLRSAPRFNSLALIQTLTVPANKKRMESQRWHRDLDDKKMLKVFIYLSDVDENSGPFTYIKESHHGGRWRGVAPQLPPMGSYPKDGEVESKVPLSFHFPVVGKAGTLIFADTSGLHRGGFCLERDRLHFVGGFTSRASALPVSFIMKPGTDMAHLSLLARYALS
jgi:hypothetical protein